MRASGRPTIGLVLVLISPSRPERAQALRDWGDFVHIREIAETDEWKTWAFDPELRIEYVNSFRLAGEQSA